MYGGIGAVSTSNHHEADFREGAKGQSIFSLNMMLLIA